AAAPSRLISGQAIEKISVPWMVPMISQRASGRLAGAPAFAPWLDARQRRRRCDGIVSPDGQWAAADRRGEHVRTRIPNRKVLAQARRDQRRFRADARGLRRRGLVVPHSVGPAAAVAGAR